jgi:hypothetical protein
MDGRSFGWKCVRHQATVLVENAREKVLFVDGFQILFRYVIYIVRFNADQHSSMSFTLTSVLRPLLCCPLATGTSHCATHQPAIRRQTVNRESVDVPRLLQHYY